MNWSMKTLGLLLLVGVLTLLPWSACQERQAWKEEARQHLAERETYQARLLVLEAERQEASALLQVERQARARAENQVAMARQAAARLRPQVEQQLDSLDDGGTQARALLEQMDLQLEGLTAQVRHAEQEMRYMQVEITVTREERDHARTQLAEAQRLLTAALNVQVPRRRLLGILPHPGDPAVFLAGSIITLLVLKD